MATALPILPYIMPPMIQIISLSLALLTSGVSLSAETSQSESAEISFVIFAGTSNLVTQAYLEILERRPDANGLITYAQYLQKGKSEDWVRAELRKSPEFRKRIVAQRLYHARTCGILILAFCLSLIILISSRNLPFFASHRYRILSLLILSCCVGCTAQYWPAFFQRKLIFLFLCSAVIAGYAFTTIDISRGFEKHRKILIVETINWIKIRHGLHYPREGMEHTGRIFDESIKKGVYALSPCVTEILEQKNQTNKSNAD